MDFHYSYAVLTKYMADAADKYAWPIGCHWVGGLRHYCSSSYRSGYQPSSSGWLCARLCMCVCLCLRVIKFCKQDVLKANLWIIVKFSADTAYTLPWTWLTFGPDHISDDWLSAILVSLQLASSHRTVHTYTFCQWMIHLATDRRKHLSVLF